MTYFSGFVLMAGSGTRIRPVFPDLPKPLIPVEGRPLAIHILESLRGSGARNVVVNLRDRADQIREGLAPFLPRDLEVSYSLEDRVIGTGGGVHKAWPLYRDYPLVVIRACDILTGYDVSRGVRDHLASGEKITLVVSDEGPPSEKGKIFLSPDGAIVFPGEPGEPSSRPVWFTGIHIVETGLLKPEPGRLPPEPYSIVDVYRSLIKKGVRIRGDVTTERWLDLGTEDGYRRRFEFLEACPGAIRREGVQSLQGEPETGIRSSTGATRPAPKE
jgi:mannose-1-phosphate guanylyltransferase